MRPVWRIGLLVGSAGMYVLSKRVRFHDSVDALFKIDLYCAKVSLLAAATQSQRHKMGYGE